MTCYVVFYVFRMFFFFFFFQAEDGIRDYKVTGVQTCALPIWRIALPPSARSKARSAGVGSRPKRSGACSSVSTRLDEGLLHRRAVDGVVGQTHQGAARVGDDDRRDRADSVLTHGGLVVADDCVSADPRLEVGGEALPVGAPRGDDGGGFLRIGAAAGLRGERLGQSV